MNTISVSRWIVTFAIAAAAFAGDLLAFQNQPQPEAPQGGGQSQTTTVEELNRRVDVLAEEVERLRSGEPELEVTPERARAMGLGFSAASVYRKERGVSFAGYGEMLYENYSSTDQAGSARNQGTQMDFLRAVMYFGYRFNDKFLFNSEVELEHANEIWLEFAYVDYIAHPAATLRGGLVLVPMGLTNEFHEPNAFLGARRTETESRIIPSTWRENGFGVVGGTGKLSYRAFIVNGMNAAGFTADGLRGGRQRGSRSRMSDAAFVGRLDATPVPGVLVGGSFYAGDSDQNQYVVGGRQLDVGTRIGEFHTQLQMRGFDLRGLVARAVLDDVAALNTARGLVGVNTIAERMDGGYVQMGYNVLSQFQEEASLTPFYRFEKFNTHKTPVAGAPANAAMDRKYHTFGFQFQPIQNVVVKTDYQWIRNVANTGLSQFNIALGYTF
jgi:hypothetical protein